MIKLLVGAVVAPLAISQLQKLPTDLKNEMIEL